VLNGTGIKIFAYPAANIGFFKMGFVTAFLLIAKNTTILQVSVLLATVAMVLKMVHAMYYQQCAKLKMSTDV